MRWLCTAACVLALAGVGQAVAPKKAQRRACRAAFRDCVRAPLAQPRIELVDAVQVARRDGRTAIAVVLVGVDDNPPRVVPVGGFVLVDAPGTTTFVPVAAPPGEAACGPGDIVPTNGTAQCRVWFALPESVHAGTVVLEVDGRRFTQAVTLRP